MPHFTSGNRIIGGMAMTLTEDVREVLLPDGVRWVLPRRQLGKARHAGWVFVGFGLAVAAFMVFWMWGTTSAGIEQVREGQRFGWALIAFGAFGVIGLIVGMGMTGFGLALATNLTHSEIAITRDRLRAIERFGAMRWTRRRPIDAIEKLEIDTQLIVSKARRSGGTKAMALGELNPDLAAMRAVGQGIQPLILAAGYPCAMVERMAHVLAERLENDGRAKLFDDARGRVKVVEYSPDDEDKPDEQREAARLEPPVGARSTLDQRDDGLTITVPPGGFFKGTKGLGCFAVLWNLFVGAFVVVMVLSALGVIPGEDGAGPGWLVFLFMLPFVAVGVGMMLFAVNMGRRQAIIDVVGDVLLISYEGLFGTKQHEWPADAVEKIIVGPSGMQVNNQPVMELQVHRREGGKVGLLGQLDDEELEWIALILRRGLGAGKGSGFRGSVDRGTGG